MTGPWPEPNRATWHIGISLHFLPAGERERYRQEWEAEMTAMPPALARKFAYGVLRCALRSGAALWLRKIFGRLVA